MYALSLIICFLYITILKHYIEILFRIHYITYFYINFLKYIV